MKVLLCHEFYQQFGGEDRSFLDEAAQLRSHGHQVVEYTRHNDAIDDRNRVGLAARSVWNARTYRELRELIRQEHPDIMHCTNIFPLISPSAYRAANVEGVPVVQALRNYRMLCPKATLMRDGHACESCINKIFPWPAVQHACYHDSRLGSAVVATMLAVNTIRGTWRRVDRFYTPSNFARNVFIRAGMPADRIDVKPNCVISDPGPGPGDGGYVLFVGRLSPEKGISTLLSAWSELQEPIPLRIIGDGPCRESVERSAASDSRITYLGERTFKGVLNELRSATCLVMPSVWYETFGRTIIESYAAGTPVVASRLGAMEEIVAHQKTGLLFQPGSSSALSHAIRALCHRTDLAAMRRRARREFEEKYTAEQGYIRLMSIYERTVGKKCYIERPETRTIKSILPTALYEPCQPTSFPN
jgi:glycosyltransferase involved in cell wall biosynthesis